MLDCGMVAFLESPAEVRCAELVSDEGEPSGASFLVGERGELAAREGGREGEEVSDERLRGGHGEGAFVEVVNLALQPCDSSWNSHRCCCYRVNKLSEKERGEEEGGTTFGSSPPLSNSFYHGKAHPTRLVHTRHTRLSNSHLQRPRRSPSSPSLVIKTTPLPSNPL